MGSTSVIHPSAEDYLGVLTRIWLGSWHRSVKFMVGLSSRRLGRSLTGRWVDKPYMHWILFADAAVTHLPSCFSPNATKVKKISALREMAGAELRPSDSRNTVRYRPQCRLLSCSLSCIIFTLPFVVHALLYMCNLNLYRVSSSLLWAVYTHSLHLAILREDTSQLFPHQGGKSFAPLAYGTVP